MTPKSHTHQARQPAHGSLQTLPATCVIDGRGVIRHAFVDRDRTQRMEPDTIIEVLEALNP